MAVNLMPRIRRQNLPPVLLQHLVDRIQQRQIPTNQLGLLAWLAARYSASRGHKAQSGAGAGTVAVPNKLSDTVLTRFPHPDRDPPG